MSNRFDTAFEKIRTALSARRKKDPKVPRVLMTTTFRRLLEAIGKSYPMMGNNLLKMLENDPNQPKRGKNVDHTRCHKTDLAKGDRSAMYRVLYYHSKKKNSVVLILVFPKSDQDNLTDDQIKKINYVTDQIEKGTAELISLDE
jgi:mRNA-degrading endonuclease RelE of RelBE toxin-antitoxin system